MNTAAFPAEMDAIDPEEPGGPEVLRLVRRPVPQPAESEVLVEVAAAGVNRPDVMQRKGLYPPPPGAPTIPGLEIAGTIVAVGESVDAALIGDKVCALVAGGGYAAYCAAPAALCLRIPAGLSLIEAAALPETLFTVWSNLFQRGGARAGERVLVHGGTSGIGTMAIGLGKLFGLEVIVTAGSDAKCARAVEMGAARAINYREADFAEALKDSIDVVLDMIGGDYLARNIACLREEGRHVSIAVQRGAKGEAPIWAVMAKRLVLTGSTLRARDAAFKAALADDIRARVWPHVEAGRLRPVIDTVVPLADAADAHRRMESSAHVGKIVLTLD